MALNRRIIVELAVFASIVIVGLNYQTIADDIALYTFTPDADISPIIDQLGLTTHAKAILYRAQPEIDDKTTFNAHCTPTVGDLELGCFVHGHIYILRIDNASLAPEMTVVLGHELLHAVWAQESTKEHTLLASELEPVYQGLNNSDLNARMADYAKTEPGQQDNELHSILGTEFPNLTPALEQHYATVFTDRTVLTKAEAQYSAVFTSQKAQLSLQAAQIKQLKAQLSSIEAQLAAYKARGEISAYNSLIPRQNALVGQVNNAVDSYNSGVDQYNALSKILDSQSITPEAN